MSVSSAGDPPALLLLLGPLDLRRGAVSVALAGRKQRSVLAILALARGRVVATSTLIDGVWGEDPPPTAANALQVYVTGLRKSLAAADLGGTLVTQAPGYRLLLPAGVLDIENFESARQRAEELVREARPDEAATCFEAALGSWRGPALADLVDEPFAAAEVDRLGELRLATVVAHLRNELAIGRAAAAVPALTDALRTEPLREELWWLLSLAYYQSSRQGDGLATLRRARRILDDELGVEPGPALRDLEARMLAQDPSLDPPSSVPPAREPVSLVTHLRSELTMMSASLVLPDATRVALDQRTTTLGRHPDSDIVVEHADASRRHAEIAAVAGGHILLDSGSTNGSYVNGALARRQLLAHGDRVEIGPMTLRYEVDEVDEVEERAT